MGDGATASCFQIRYDEAPQRTITLFYLWTFSLKQIVAIVRPFLAEKVLNALKLAPLEALVVREVKGFGRQKSYLDQYGDSEYSEAFLPKVEITMWVDEARVEETVRKIVDASRSGRMGDGKIMIMPVMDFTSIIDAEAVTNDSSSDQDHS